MVFDSQYTDTVLENMQQAYGKGFLSPGGAAEVGDLVEGLELAGRTVLDLGCGVGGAALMLADELGAGSVLGIDVEQESVNRANQAATDRGLDGRVRFQMVEPGPLPLADAAFDAVFSKDVICHVPDKAALFAEVRRVLRPGGMLVCGDFLRGADGPAAADYEAWFALITASGLRFHFEPESVYHDALEAAGLAEVEIRDHSAWSAVTARRQMEQLNGPAGEALRRSLGEDGLAGRLAQTEARARALESGGLRHCHLRAKRPD